MQSDRWSYLWTVAQVPTQGVFTLYPYIGDLFGWPAVVGLVTITIWTIVRLQKTKSATREAEDVDAPQALVRKAAALLQGRRSRLG